MIVYKKGDILADEAEALVNTVNCVGVMGKGVALQFKKAFPENFKAYSHACQKEQVQPGKMMIFKTDRSSPPLYIVNFPTKRHWKGKSRIEDIESGLKDLSKFISEEKIQSIAIPPLGCGLGGLKWSEVKPLMERSLGSFNDAEIRIYEPKGAPPAGRGSGKIPNMTAGRAALITLMHRYLNGLLDPEITLLEVHKLMYFLQESGQSLRLKYSKGFYGPYANNLRHVLSHIEGYYTSGFVDGSESPGKELKIIPGAVEDAEKFLKEDKKVVENLQKVFDLIEGFESSFGLELLSTVHWVAKYESAQTFEETVQRVYDWGLRKKQFTPQQIQSARKVLSEKRWV